MWLIETVVDIVVDIVLGLVRLLDRSGTQYAAYRAAWKRRAVTGDERLELLVSEDGR